MKRWNAKLKQIKENKKVDLFLEDIIRVYRKHGMAISHQDCQGSFGVSILNDGYIEWINAAEDHSTP